MGSVLADIDDRLAAWMVGQPLFFVATAPAELDGHVNLSPKGGRGTFAVLGPHEVAYVDLYGSGVETVAHLKENGRIVIMLCAFEGPPKIVRLHGHGEVVEQADTRWGALFARFTLADEVLPTVRSIVRVQVSRISDSCGFVVPEMAYVRDRQQLFNGAASSIRRHGPDAIRDYCDVNNAQSIDGLPALSPHGGRVSDEQRRTFAHEGRKL
jgi:pyridoxamine 5'-phosphate oxidase-like protein